MKTSFIKKSNQGQTVSNILFAIVAVSIVYGCYLYIPVVYKSQELEALVKDYSFKTSQATEEMIRAAIIEDAKAKLDITLNVDDVVINRGDGRTKISATWNAPIELPFGYVYYRQFKVEYDRKSML